MREMYIIPDSNIFLHFTPLDQIDLSGILDNTDVTLVITKILLDELDDHKHGSRKGLRDRAHRSLVLIEEWLKTEEIRSGIQVITKSTPDEGTFKKNKLNDKSKDDWYIASALELIDQPDHANIGILSDDTGMRLRAKDYAIKTYHLPDENRLPPSDDKLNKENFKLKSQLKELQYKQPKPKLLFRGGSDKVVILARDVNNGNIEGEGLSSIDNNVNNDTSDQIDESNTVDLEPSASTFKNTTKRDPEESRKLVEMVAELRKNIAPILERMESKLEIPPEEHDRYNMQYLEYNKQINKYNEAFEEASKRIRQIITLDFELFNEGGSEAEDMRITLSLPSHIEWRDTDGHELLPKKPSPPLQPRNRMELQRAEMLSQYGNSQMFRRALPLYDTMTLPNTLNTPSNVHIRGYEGHSLDIRVRSCFHNSSIEIPEVNMEFLNDSDPSTFEIHCLIKEKNTPEMINNKLLVSIEHENE